MPLSSARSGWIWCISLRDILTSYLWAVGFTFLFACMVDFFLYFKLNRINMAEALKSVE